ncbi:MAG: hypothetical protein SVM79_06355 [Chloroflexota bacterium]|nr:hypothetical protein [Chloroflexota bacterium]
MYCYRHPTTETNLRCGKCDKYICPKCTVQTLVGARCPDCANITRSPVVQVSVQNYGKAIGIGLGSAIGIGIVWRLLDSYLWGFSYLMVLFAGYAIGELISRAVNRRQGQGLQAIAGISVVICYLVATTFHFHLSPFGLLALVAGIFIAISRLR